MIPKKVKWGVLRTDNSVSEEQLSFFGCSPNAELYAIAGSKEKIQSVSNRLHVQRYYEG
ncbi:hypothetical protein [Effusibacillus dendaii]|uniref:hypothetical protein n=1 Tax=Effusibacillus dendaii TaxID=2743772 RepID=UPI00190BCDC1|nr:hypothetical protein [Effusibacillus dendaii]